MQQRAPEQDGFTAQLAIQKKERRIKRNTVGVSDCGFIVLCLCTEQSGSTWCDLSYPECCKEAMLHISKVYYIFLLACGGCLHCTASQLPLYIHRCICFVTWEYITYSHLCGKRILWILARQGAVCLDQILPYSRFFIQAGVLSQMHSLILKGRCTK